MTTGACVVYIGYTFEAYTQDQLLEILKVMCSGKGEELAADILPQVYLPHHLLFCIPGQVRSRHLLC
jgi:hypothetical protein